MKHLKTFKQLYDKTAEYLPSESVQMVEKAYEFAKHAHEGQYRKSGNPYITHPVSVAYILSELHQDAKTICAGLLHDTIEDANASKEDMVQAFGEDVYELVEGVTHLGRIYFGSKEEEQAENFRKMFLAMAKDLRVVIIKLADRLHNMRTLHYLSPAQQARISKETLDIFAPLAHRLGMGHIKWELEDLAFYYLEPIEYQKIKEWVASRRDEREKYVQSLCGLFQKKLDELSIPAEISGRPKHFYSIYRKLLSQDLSYDELFDTIGVRVIVHSDRECYAALGIVHSMFKPIDGRFKDYIAMPKSNMYQSLHTTVIGPLGSPVEIQIRTSDMHQIAEYGIAAHWRYKGSASVAKPDADMSWLRQIVDLQQEKTAPSEFFQNLKLDLFIDEIFVFTPKGDVQVFPKGATPVDFAYRVHTEIGHRTIGAKTNGRIVNLNYQLKNGDRVEILTSNKENPRIDWLYFVKTPQARSKIKQWFKKQTAFENTEKGGKMLEKQLLLADYKPKDVLTQENLTHIKSGFSLTRWETVYLLIGQGDLSPVEIVAQLDRIYNKAQLSEPLPLKKTMGISKLKKSPREDVIVVGEDNIQVSMAKCCAPLPGDDIIGFITIRRGVTVHRRDCAHILNLDSGSQERLIEVSWNPRHSGKTYSATFFIEAFDRIGLLQDITKSITDAQSNILGVSSKLNPGDAKVTITIEVEVQDREKLMKIKEAISRLSDIVTVYRVMGRA